MARSLSSVSAAQYQVFIPFHGAVKTFFLSLRFRFFPDFFQARKGERNFLPFFSFCFSSFFPAYISQGEDFSGVSFFPGGVRRFFPVLRDSFFPPHHQHGVWKKRERTREKWRRFFSFRKRLFPARGFQPLSLGSRSDDSGIQAGRDPDDWIINRGPLSDESGGNIRLRRHRLRGWRG